jgi:hypothetical protein
MCIFFLILDRKQEEGHEVRLMYLMLDPWEKEESVSFRLFDLEVTIPLSSNDYPFIKSAVLLFFNTKDV